MLVVVVVSDHEPEPAILQTIAALKMTNQTHLNCKKKLAPCTLPTLTILIAVVHFRLTMTERIVSIHTVSMVQRVIKL